MSVQHAQYMLLFLVLLVGSAWFQVLELHALSLDAQSSLLTIYSIEFSSLSCTQMFMPSAHMHTFHNAPAPTSKSPILHR